MKTFSCRDAGISCDWRVNAESEDEIVQQALEHGRQHHGIQVSDNPKDSFTQELRNKVRSKIQDVKAA